MGVSIYSIDRHVTTKLKIFATHFFKIQSHLSDPVCNRCNVTALQQRYTGITYIYIYVTVYIYNLIYRNFRNQNIHHHCTDPLGTVWVLGF